jgi:hypothetical protein
MIMSSAGSWDMGKLTIRTKCAPRNNAMDPLESGGRQEEGRKSDERKGTRATATGRQFHWNPAEGRKKDGTTGGSAGGGAKPVSDITSSTREHARTQSG